MASAAGVIAIIGEIAQLEPIAFGLVVSLIQGLKGKTDAEILAGDASDWSDIVATAHAESVKATPIPPVKP